MPARHRHAEFPQHRLGLIFVDVHADLYVSRMQGMHASLRSARKFGRSALLAPRAAALRPRLDHPHFARFGAIFLQASTSVATASADCSNMARSLPFN